MRLKIVGLCKREQLPMVEKMRSIDIDEQWDKLSDTIKDRMLRKYGIFLGDFVPDYVRVEILRDYCGLRVSEIGVVDK